MPAKTDLTAQIVAPITFVEVLVGALCAEGRWCRCCGEEMLLDTGESVWTCLVCGMDELIEELVAYDDD